MPDEDAAVPFLDHFSSSPQLQTEEQIDDRENNHFEEKRRH